MRLRANTRVQRRTAARTPAARRPSTPAPAGTPSPLQPVSQTTAAHAVAPVATPAPASTMNKTRGRGTAAGKTAVPKQRVQSSRSARPDRRAAHERDARPDAAVDARAPRPTLRPVQGGGQPSTGVGAADGVLHRVPPTHP